MKIIRSVFIVLSVLLLLACGGNSVEGTYYNVDNGNEYIQLKNGGEFYLKAGPMDFTGKYTVDGKTIILNPGSNTAATGRIEKDIIIDNDGTKWRKR